jgi:D-tyrosyl-tRNA(Tyr) deacylase
VSEARVTVSGSTIGEISRGLLVLVGVSRGDGDAQAKRLAERLLAYRVFADAAGKMNLSVRDIGGSVLLVPQFTLAADTSGGLRPSFSTAAAPDVGATLFERFVEHVRLSGVPFATGRFGADMKVALTNDGPVTFWLEVEPTASA